MEKITVIAIRLINGQPWDNGDRVVAFFDCSIGNINFRECMLLETLKHGPLAQLPRGMKRDDGVRLAHINDHAMRCELTTAASNAYRALTAEAA